MPTFTPLLRTVALDPIRAEIQINWSLQAADELRGKLAGPSCRYASTIEIAYPIQRRKSGYHVLIPEPSAWDPVSPLLYAGKIERFRDAKKVEETRVLHGLVQLTRAPGGWRLNGKPFEPRCVRVESGSEEELLDFRERGFNTLIPRESAADLWERAAWIGFFVQAPEGMELADALRGHFLTLPTQ